MQSIWADAKIMVVDDLEQNVRLLRRVLSRAGYIRIESAYDGDSALDLFRVYDPDIILLDLHMPGMNGAELLRRIRSVLSERTYLPVLVLTADASAATKREVLAAGAMDYIAKPFDMEEIILRVGNLLQTRSLHLHMEERIADRTRSLQAAQMEILDRLVIAGEFRDDETGQHAKRVGDMAAKIAMGIGYSASEAELIRRAAPLHDVGKIAIPDNVLLKPDKLTDKEWAVMKQHTVAGAVILEKSDVEVIQLAETIALSHHERWDGSGYPHGLSGEQIPEIARIVAVADVYDALTHSRPYRPAWTSEEALAEIERSSGSHFDPRIVSAFIALLIDTPEFVPAPNSSAVQVMVSWGESS